MNTSKDDAFLRPSFTFQERLRRGWWQLFYLLFFRFSPTPLHGYRRWLLIQFGARIGESNFIYPSARVWAPWNLQTEEVVTIGPNVEIYNPAIVRLGHHTIISQGAYLCGATHDYNSSDFDYIALPITSGAYVWVCARAIVLPGVSLGEGAVLGAGAVAVKSLDDWTVYAGNPCKALRIRVNAADKGKPPVTNP